ncbi:MAG TPA: biotin--[acetyl-CoA-carboxylase] ligase [Prevotella sp.]|nr:biotin--[acetyl-CoA-carboxylase] ligase [Prevotella sp.]
MKKKIIYIDEIDSTNLYLKSCPSDCSEDMTVAVANYQSAGKGQGTNTWESEAGKNLLFSILVHPVWVPVARQFLLSMAHALSLKDALNDYSDGFAVKWPNDIYWEDQKISGTLIETTLGQGHIKDCIFGTGVDVNQQVFLSGAPNPVSLCQIVGHEVDRQELLEKILGNMDRYMHLLENGDYIDIAGMYHDSLYRKHGFYLYRDAEGLFEGAIVEVEDDGHLILRDRAGVMRSYAFKEVEFVLPSFMNSSI